MFFGKTIANNTVSQSVSSSDYQLQLYVDQVMRRYDANNNGVLEPDEIVLFFNELLVGLLNIKNIKILCKAKDKSSSCSEDQAAEKALSLLSLKRTTASSICQQEIC